MSENELITKKMYVTIFFRMIFLPPAMMAMLHWPANDLYWLDGWLLVVFLTVVAFIALVWLLHKNPQIIVERLKGNFQEGQSKMDSLIVILLSLFMLTIFPVAGFDYRYNLFQLSIGFKVAGWILSFLSIWILAKVFKANIFLSRSIIIQEKHEHKVVDFGPYAIVRHPMYTGTMVMLIGFVLLLGSGVALIPSLFSLILIYIRAFLEEKLLTVELEGYNEYKEKVRKRIIPYLL